MLFHKFVSGRIGGASRWTDRLDDMPTAGWGYGALTCGPNLCLLHSTACPTFTYCICHGLWPRAWSVTANRTGDFLALLYGHMATYQSRGSFHSTEQLGIQMADGSAYRKFIHWTDPRPPPNSFSSWSASSHLPSADVAMDTDSGIDGVGAYDPQEQDISYCIVSAVLVARLTRWQLVLDEPFRGSMVLGAPRADPARVWLARGAPKRWFKDGGFSVNAAPCLAGDVSYVVSAQSEADVPGGGASATFVYNVTVDAPSEATMAALPAATLVGVRDLIWTLRWPAALVQSADNAPLCDAGCTVAAVDLAGGFVSVRMTAASARPTAAAGVARGRFSVRASIGPFR